MILEAIPKIKKLSVAEKLLLVNELWDSLALHEEDIPLDASHKKVLDERLQEHRSNPQAGSPWKEVRSRILKRS